MLNLLSLIAIFAIIPISFGQSPSSPVIKPPEATVATSGSNTSLRSSTTTSSQKSLSKSSNSTTQTSTRASTLSATTSVTLPLSNSTTSTTTSSTSNTKSSSSTTTLSSSTSTSTSPSSSSSSTSSSSASISSSFTSTSTLTTSTSSSPSSSSNSSSASTTSSTSSSSSTTAPITSPHGSTVVVKTTYTVSKHSTHDSDTAGGFFIFGGDGGGVLAFPALFKDIMFDIPDGELSDVEPGPDGKPSTTKETPSSSPTKSTTSSSTCSITTAYDYWIECLSTTKSGQVLTCKTTSTSMMTGCFPTATAVTTTVAAACELPTDNDDQGEDGSCPSGLACNDSSCSGTPTGVPPGGICQFIFGGCSCTFSKGQSITTTSTTTSGSSSSVVPCPTVAEFQNPGFEANVIAPWTNTCGFEDCGYGQGTVVVVDNEKPHSGSYAVDVSNLASGDDQYTVEFYLYQEVFACAPGTYTLSFWAATNTVADCTDGCCAIAVVLNDSILYESPGYYQLDVPTSYTQFNIQLGDYTSPTALKIGLADINCYVENLYFDDFSLTIS